jgi:serine/threonine-protein kinase
MSEALLELIADVVDGVTPQWDEAIEASSTVRDRRLLGHLRTVAGVAEVHRSLCLDVPSVFSPHVPLSPTPEGPRGRWGHFELLECVGAGFYGEVFKAFDMKLHRLVAVKLLKGDRERSADDWHRALEEARALARVEHDHVVKVHSVQIFDGRPGLEMEYVDGPTFEQYVRESPGVDVSQVRAMGADVCGALAAVHRAKLLHCDIKPRNVMRAASGRLKLMDFGAGRFVTGNRASVVGTPLCASPEVLRGHAPTEASDIYGIGILLFYAVTGDYPVRAASIDELLALHTSGRRTRLADTRADLPKSLTEVIDKALEFEPSARFASADELVSALAAPPDRTSLSRARVSPRTVAPVLVLLLATVTLVSAAFAGRASMPRAHTRVAVLPFENRTNRPAWEVDASSDDVLNGLARLPGATVSPWSSVATYSTRPAMPTRDVARQLGVDWVVRGSVDRGTESELMMSLTLDDASGQQVWSRQYPTSAAGLATWPVDVLRSLPAQLGLQVAADARSRHDPLPDARAAWAKARYLMRQTGSANYREALDLLKQAVQFDPAYAVAHVALAQCAMALENAAGVSRGEAYQLARDALEQASRLDPDLPELHVNLGTLRFEYEWDWPAAGQEFRLALQLNPSDPIARVEYANYLAARGATNGAVEQARMAQDIDPWSPHRGDVGFMLYFAHRFDESVQMLEERIDEEPDQPLRRFTLARAYSAAGRYDDAVRELHRTIQLEGGVGHAPFADAELARVYGTRGAPEATKLLADLEASLDPIAEPNRVAHIAYIYLALGSRDRGFEYLRQAAIVRAKSLIWARVDPRLDGVRDDSRYKTLIRDLRLPE